MFNDQLIPLPEDVFRLLRDFIHDYCGIFFDDGSKFLLERRLNRRLEQHQLKSFEEYYHFLRYDRKREEEIIVLVDNLTTNETYFFRESRPAQGVLRRDPPRASQAGTPGRRACASGAPDARPARSPIRSRSSCWSPANWWRDWQVEIMGSDINQRVLHTARKGMYKKGSHRATPPEMLRKYFVEEGKGDYRIIDAVRQLVSFSYVNLLDPFKTSLIRDLDIIFCRNVIIYFDRNAKKKVIETFYDKLQEGGYLLLGHSESLINLSTAFTLRTLKNDMVYQKPVRVRTG